MKTADAWFEDCLALMKLTPDDYANLERTGAAKIQIDQFKDYIRAIQADARKELEQERDTLQRSYEQHVGALKIATDDATALRKELAWCKKHMAESDKELCQIQDWLSAGGDILQSSSEVAEKCKERVRDLVAKEGELGDLQRSNAELERKCFQLEHGKYNAKHYALQAMELAASAERLREAIAQLFDQKSGSADYSKENEAVLIGYSFHVNSKVHDDLKSALSTNPSDALKEYMKPWVEFVEQVNEVFPSDQARQLLSSIKP